MRGECADDARIFSSLSLKPNIGFLCVKKMVFFLFSKCLSGTKSYIERSCISLGKQSQSDRTFYQSNALSANNENYDECDLCSARSNVSRRARAHSNIKLSKFGSSSTHNLVQYKVPHATLCTQQRKRVLCAVWKEKGNCFREEKKMITSVSRKNDYFKLNNKHFLLPAFWPPFSR